MRQRIAIIGLGMAVTPHARSLVDLEAAGLATVVAAVARSGERREAFARTYPFPTSGDVEQVFADPSIGVVGILTPPNTHLELVRRAAAAGKHVLLEKPLEVTPDRSTELVRIAETAGIKLGVVLQHRFRPAGERLQTHIAQGTLGDLVNCSTSIRLWRPQSYYDEPGRGTLGRDGGGVLLTQAIHTLDLMLSLAGPIAEVQAFVRTSPVHRMETEDMVAATVRFRSGAIGVIEATTAAYPGAPERIEIAGTRGGATLAGTSLSVRCLDGIEDVMTADGSAGGTGADPMAFPHDYHRAVWADFLEAVARAREPRVTGREALGVHRLIEAILEAGRTGRSVALSG